MKVVKIADTADREIRTMFGSDEAEKRRRVL